MDITLARSDILIFQISMLPSQELMVMVLAFNQAVKESFLKTSLFPL